jgi:electron transfer flavoprotein beta subunit
MLRELSVIKKNLFLQKAKKKPITKTTAKDLGVDISPRISVVSVEDPPVRQPGVILPDVDALVGKLKEGGHI